MSKKVIFVGGTSYSGSTFFHLTLANDPKGFGIGEVKHLFRPTKEKHDSSTWMCGCGDPDCQLWSRVKKYGEKHLYEALFELHPEIDYIVDASKNIVWIDYQANNLARQGIETRHVVIWKTLLEYAHSLQKRNRLNNHDKAGLANWPRYHKSYSIFIEEFRAVKYSEYVHEQSSVLPAVCAYLDIPYFEGKERFWEKTHHVLGGNLSSRIHLYSEGSERFLDVQRRARSVRRELGSTTHRQVYYEEPQAMELSDYIDALREKHKDIDLIEKLLVSCDVRNAETSRRPPELRAGVMDKYTRRLRQARRDHLSKPWAGLATAVRGQAGRVKTFDETGRNIMRLPNFIIGGAIKGGTTSLNYYLKQHPEVYMSVFKEPRYFAYEPDNPDHVEGRGLRFPIRTLKEYAALFEGVTTEKAVGEASPHYLRSPAAPQGIKETIPEVKLIFSLRHPIKRAYSSYWHKVRLGMEDRPVEEALGDGEQAVLHGLYSQSLQAWYDRFEPEQIKVVLFEELVRDGLAVFADICRFLGVDDTFVPDMTVRNKGGAMKNQRLGRFYEQVKTHPLRQAIDPFVPERLRVKLLSSRNNNLEEPPPMPVAVAGRLQAFYREDIARLEELIHRDLSIWKN